MGKQENEVQHFSMEENTYNNINKIEMPTVGTIP